MFLNFNVLLWPFRAFGSVGITCAFRLLIVNAPKVCNTSQINLFYSIISVFSLIMPDNSLDFILKVPVNGQ